MEEQAKILSLVSESGMITSKQVRDAGIHPHYLQKLVRSGKLQLISRGIYMCSDMWEDEIFLVQQRYQKGIYSHDTALYLHNYSDRTPAKYTMTFPNYELGLTEIQSPSGNMLKVYDLERTLCDIVRGSGCDIQIITDAMKRYAAAKNRNINKLIQYAEQLRVKPKILRYMEVLL